MNDINNILVPVDFTNESKAAFKAANRMATRFDAKIHVVHFMPYHPVVVPVYSGESLSQGTSVLGEQKMEDEKTKLLSQLRIEMDKYVVDEVRGSVYVVADILTDGIHDFLAQKDVDMIISGANGEDCIFGQLVGNSTEKIIRNSKIPVLAVSNEEDIILEDILIATDLSAKIPEQLYNLCRILEHMGTTLHFVNINTTELLNEADILAKLSALVEYLKVKNYKLHVVPERKEINGILKVIKQINPGLILMKTYQKSMFWTLLQGSLAEDVIRKTDVPVLVERI